MKAAGEKEIIRLLELLVETRSVNPPGNEIVAADVLREYLETHGIKVRYQRVAKNRPNLLCSINGGTPGRTLLLSSHLDVVGAPENVTRDIFVPFRENRRLYGRGACDAKGALAAMAAAMVNLKNSEFSGSVMFAAVVGEEIGGVGSKFLTTKGVKADAAVIGEPTGLAVAIAHKGRLGIAIELAGAKLHPAAAAAGERTVIDDAVLLLQELKLHAAALKKRKNTLLGSPTLLVKSIHAGEKDHSLPSACAITLDRRLLPEETHGSASEETAKMLAEFRKKIKSALKVSFQHGAFPAATAPSERVAACAQRVLSACGLDSRPAGFPASCDMYVFQRAGIPSVILGPGSLALAHHPAEYVETDQVCKAAEIYSAIAKEFLKRD